LMMMNMFHKSRVYMKVVMDTKLSDDDEHVSQE